MQGQWSGQWSGSWQGNAGKDGNPVVVAGLKASGQCGQLLGARLFIAGALVVSGHADKTLAARCTVRAALLASGGASGVLFANIGGPPKELAPEYRSAVYGSDGKSRLYSLDAEREGLTREHVEQSWDLAETKRRIQAEDAAKKVAASMPTPALVKLDEAASVKPQSGGIPPLYTDSAKLALAHIEQAQAAKQLIADKANAAELSEIRQRRADEDAFILALFA